jgi:membrane protein
MSSTPSRSLMERARTQLQTLSETLAHWPWRDTVVTLYQRFREDRLGLTASSLTFTTLIALVPLITVMLAIFSAFPMFAGFQLALENYFLQNLIPGTIARPVLHALTQFAVKAGQLGTVGFAALMLTALALMLTIDRTLNSIWRVRRRRPFTQRVLIYWAALTLGPLLVGVSLTLTTYALSNTTPTARSISASAALWLQAFEFFIFALGVAAFFRFVPNTHVRWRHAWAGGVFVAVGLQVAKHGLAGYVSAAGTYSNVYGAFAAVPIFLLWVYLAWVIVLLGAVISAYAPSLSMHIVNLPNTAGQRFAMSLDVLRVMHAARDSEARGLPMDDLARQLRTDPLKVEPVVDAMIDMDWMARIEEGGAQRIVLLVDPVRTSASALIDRTLMAPNGATQALRQRLQLDAMTLAELIA